MDAETKAAYEAKSKHLRAQLKQWENDWAKSHDGKKPGRQDIKADAEIARKYKDYNTYRHVLSGKAPPALKPLPKPNKRPSDDAPAAATPLKRTKHAETPSRRQNRSDDDLMNTPAISRKLFSPAPVTSLGPTPQRDGRVLGLFDLLLERELGTPSKNGDDTHPRPRPHGTPSRARTDILSTPRRRASETGGKDHFKSTTAAGLDQTPTTCSAGRKHALNLFTTPTKYRRRESIDGGKRTPSSAFKLQFDTPVFLRRHPTSFPPPVGEDASFADPAPLRLPRKPLVRGLSEIVASLRKVEEEALDDDLEALREMESEAAAGAPRPASPPLRTEPKPAPASVLGPDSQGRPLLLGGFDTEEMYDSPHEDASLDQSGSPLPPSTFKKKGQKRTTRKVNIRPIWKKRPPQAAAQEGASDDTEVLVPDTQLSARPDGPGSFEDESSSSAGETQPGHGADKKKKKKKTTTSQAKGDGPVKRAARKVNELAHANFKRLKLRNYGAKGGPGVNSRFRRRR